VLGHVLSFLPVASAASLAGTCTSARAVATDRVHLRGVIARELFPPSGQVRALELLARSDDPRELYRSFAFGARAAPETSLEGLTFMVCVDGEGGATKWFPSAARGWPCGIELRFPEELALALARESLYDLVGGATETGISRALGTVRIMVVDEEGRSGRLGVYSEFECHDGEMWTDDRFQGWDAPANIGQWADASVDCVPALKECQPGRLRGYGVKLELQACLLACPCTPFDVPDGPGGYPEIPYEEYKLQSGKPFGINLSFMQMDWRGNASGDPGEAQGGELGFRDTVLLVRSIARGGHVTGPRTNGPYWNVELRGRYDEERGSDFDM
jgi:hypothetical protein